MSKKTKWIIQILFFLTIIGLTGYGVIKNHDLNEVLSLIAEADLRWFLPGFVLVLIFICCESWIFHLIFKSLKTSHSIFRCMIYSFVGFFFSCITPGASGGQPMQMLFMHRDDIPASVSTPLLLIVTVTYKAVLLFFAIILFILHPEDVMKHLEPVRYFCLFGFALNIIVITLYILLIFKPAIVEAIADRALRIAKRFVGEQKQKKWSDYLENYIIRYQKTAQRFRKRTKLIIKICVISLFQRCLIFIIPYLAMRALGINSLGFFTVLSLQAMISLGTDLLPLPGGAGAYETMFVIIYEPLIGELMTVPVLLMSRGTSYYGQLIMCAVMTGIAVFTIQRKGRKHEKKIDRCL